MKLCHSARHAADSHAFRGAAYVNIARVRNSAFRAIARKHSACSSVMKLCQSAIYTRQAADSHPFRGAAHVTIARVPNAAFRASQCKSATYAKPRIRRHFVKLEQSVHKHSACSRCCVYMSHMQSAIRAKPRIRVLFVGVAYVN